MASQSAQNHSTRNADRRTQRQSTARSLAQVQALAIVADGLFQNATSASGLLNNDTVAATNITKTKSLIVLLQCDLMTRLADWEHLAIKHCHQGWAVDDSPSGCAL